MLLRVRLAWERAGAAQRARARGHPLPAAGRLARSTSCCNPQGHGDCVTTRPTWVSRNGRRLPRSCRSAGATKRERRENWGCPARSFTGGFENTSSKKAPAPSGTTVNVWRSRHAPIQSNEADPARAVGTFLCRHAQAGTMSVSRSGAPVCHCTGCVRSAMTPCAHAQRSLHCRGLSGETAHGLGLEAWLRS